MGRDSNSAVAVETAVAVVALVVGILVVLL